MTIYTMEYSHNEDYACQCDPQQPKTRRPRPKKEVHKPDPKKIFEQPGGAQKPPASKPRQRKGRRSKARKASQSRT
eukprot:COSAG03_NODE_7646_length_889_cov_1.108861_1_plen_76_part_00